MGQKKFDTGCLGISGWNDLNIVVLRMYDHLKMRFQFPDQRSNIAVILRISGYLRKTKITAGKGTEILSITFLNPADSGLKIFSRLGVVQINEIRRFDEKVYFRIMK